MRALIAALVLLFASAASAQDLDAGVTADARVIVDARPDARRWHPIDGGRRRVRDAALDAIDDAAVEDADAEIPDAEIPDAEVADAEILDAEIPDAEIADAEMVDADADLDAAVALVEDAAPNDAAIVFVAVPVITPQPPERDASAAAATATPEITILEGAPPPAPGSSLRELLPDWHLVYAAPAVLLVLLLLALAASALIARARAALPHAGLLPLLASLGHVLVRAIALAVGVSLLVRLLPSEMWPAMPLTLAAAAIALGLSVRDLLPDVIAGVVLAFEQRVVAGSWLAGEGFGGIVERRSLRATWLRDGHGRRVAVPNRVLLRGPIASQIATGPVHDTTLRVISGEPAPKVRAAILDAVLASPWVRPEITPSVRRDGENPMLWHVRAGLLDLRFGGHFEGDLLERTEEMLARDA